MGHHGEKSISIIKLKSSGVRNAVGKKSYI